MSAKRKTTSTTGNEPRDPPLHPAQADPGTPTGTVGADLVLHGMHCDSCGKIIERTVRKFSGARIRHFDTSNNRISLSCSSTEQLREIREALRTKGYQTLEHGEEAEDGYEAGSIHRGLGFLRLVYAGTDGFETENLLVRYAAGAFAALIVIHAILYLAVFSRIPGYLDTYWSVTLLTAVAVVALLFAYCHASGFRKNFSCMCGMMTGMTFGMAGGFLIGAFAGATNGMFVGSLVGMAVGIGFGYVTGRYCGVMGIMEGIMGGLMAGTMGAMLSVMMVFDHLIPFLFILTAVEAVILVAFSYMLWKEHGNMTPDMLKMDVNGFIAVAVAFDLVLTVVYVFGPKAGTVLGGF